MTCPHLIVAEFHLACAEKALLAEAGGLTIGDDYGVMDALSLTMDALSQVRGEISSRLPERPILDRRAS